MEEPERPLSPHLQVYRPQLTSILSILHRATGIFLSAGLLLLVYWLRALTQSEPDYLRAQAILTSFPGQILLLGFAWSLFYHLANGVRHLLWDTGWGLDLRTTYLTGYTVVIVSFLATALLWWAAQS